MLDRMPKHHRKSLVRESYVSGAVCYSDFVEKNNFWAVFALDLLLLLSSRAMGRGGFMGWEVRSIPWHQRAQSLS